MPTKKDQGDSDDEARKATAGRTERATFPGIPPRFVPPRPASDEVTPPEPAVVMRREREAAARRVARPLPLEIPSLLPPAEHESSPPMAPRAPQKTLTGGFARKDSPAPVSLPEPYQLPLPAAMPQIEPSLMAKAAGFPLPKLLVLIAASATAAAGFVAALGNAASQIITALKPSYERAALKAEFEQELEPIKARVNADFGLTGETKARVEEEAKLQSAIETVGNKAATAAGLAERVQKLEDKSKPK
jgi:hypothetical protein